MQGLRRDSKELLDRNCSKLDGINQQAQVWQGAGEEKDLVSVLLAWPATAGIVASSRVEPRGCKYTTIRGTKGRKKAIPRLERVRRGTASFNLLASQKHRYGAVKQQIWKEMLAWRPKKRQYPSDSDVQGTE